MSNFISNFHYRPEIDGLRAVAVIAVVLFHAELGVTGGYIGVDVFFVISGFLITSLIIKELENGKFTIINFWEKRARRIIPAMAVVILVTLVAGWFLLLPSDFITLGRSAAWQAVFAANIYFWFNTGYFAGLTAEQPLLHTWSLAVEEQFYMVAPLILLGLYRIQVFRNRNFLLILITIGIVISLAISIYGVAKHPAGAFYLLPTRVWELLCGAFVALVPGVWLLRSTRAREIVSFLGLAGILVPCWFYTKTTPFPGLAAVLPCLGAGMFIWSSTNAHRPNFPELPTVARLLSCRPIVFIGLISYSLYLWHWPLFAFSTYWALEPRSLIYSLAIVAISFLLAVLTWHYVETPFRKRTVCVEKKEMFTFGATCIAVVFAVGVVLISGNGFPMRLSSKAIEYANAKEDKASIHELTAVDIDRGRLIAIGNPDSQAVSFLIWGDSHAMAAAPAFDQFIKAKGMAGLQATASATAPVLGAYWQNEFVNRKDAIAFNDAVFNYIKKHHIPNVVLVGYWEYYVDDRGSTPLSTAMVSTVKKLVEAGTRPWVMLQVPHPLFDVPKGLAKASIFNFDLKPLLSAPLAWNGFSGNGDLIFKRIEAAGGHILDPGKCFMDGSGSHLLVEKNGKPLFRDVHHLSANGAKLVLAPCLNEILNLGGM